ncbi:MAG: hypothetical protein WCK67_12685 [bacterium]
MNMSAMSSPKIGFAGVYGSAKKVNEDGTRTPFKINLPNDDASLFIDNGNSHSKLENGQVRLWLNEGGVKSNAPKQKNSAVYEDVAIDKVDGNSRLNINAYDQFSIGTLKDNAELTLSGKDKFSGAWAEIGEIVGKNVKMILGEGTKAEIEEKADFNLQSTNINNARIIGENLQIKG